ncbi:MAG: cation:proton antiporter [Bacteroidales bacterium]|nr:cation:proton antiporter [Candidatus Cacconaster merdequi]
MSSELKLVTELAIILISAGVFTVISKALKQPLILGYIIAGFIIGPHLGLFPQFSPESVHEWSELGIIFLLFGLGLEFNFKKLLNVGSTAIIAALTICLGMFLTGFMAGSALQWTKMESIFLGGMMGMSSTTIIIKAYDDLGIKNKPYATLVFGLLVVEDLLAVLMMVLFSTLAVSNKFSGGDMLLSLGKLVIFLVLCFLVGIYVFPSLLKKASRYISDEILLLISIGLCFLMVVLANLAGFSSALGAFLMGSILSSTVEGERIEHLTIDIKNLFGAIFFVSVGMMVDPSVIFKYWPVILVITVVAMAGILLFSTVGVLFAGKSLDTALHVGFSLPQLGEFSFIIAGLGCSLGVVSDFIYPVIIAVSVITTFTTPYMIKAADPVSAWMHRILPDRIITRLARRAQKGGAMNRAERSEWKIFMKKYVIRVAIYSMILFVMTVALKKYLPLLTDTILPDIDSGIRSLIDIAASLAIMSPFIYGLAVNKGELKKISENIVKKDSRAKIPITAAVIFRIFLAVEFALSAILMFAHLSGWSIMLVFASLVAIILVARRSTRSYNHLEDRFFANLNEKETLRRQNAPVSATLKSRLEGYDVHTKEIPVLPDFVYAGLTLREMPFRKDSGVNIVKIRRGSKSILIPSGSEVIFPGDTLVAVGSTSQLESFEKTMNGSYIHQDTITEDFVVERIVLDDESELTGMLLKDTRLRPSGCLLVSVARDGEMITNPHKNFKFAAGDILWIAGLKSSVEWLKK